MDYKKLEKLGLTRNESIVYLSLLKLGSTSAQNLVKESELHRSRVYDALESLQRKGLAGFVVKDFKKYFQAVEPEKLFGYIEEQKEVLKEIMPELKDIKGMKKEEISAAVYKGKEGLKAIHSEMLKEGKDIRVLGAKGYIMSELPYFMPNFERERIKKRMKWICLWDTEEIKTKIMKLRRFVQGDVLPKGCESNSVVNIFGNKVAIVLWKEKYPTAFMIDNKDVADAFKTWFDVVRGRCK
jgi:sugar-specific transcriptional regulator TrmB